MKNLIYIVAFLFSISICSQIEKIEPPFWWAGMHNPELQLMVHGDRIAAYEVSISDSINIIDVIKTENPNYQFITISTEKIQSGTVTINFSKDK